MNGEAIFMSNEIENIVYIPTKRIELKIESFEKSTFKFSNDLHHKLREMIPSSHVIFYDLIRTQITQEKLARNLSELSGYIMDIPVLLDDKKIHLMRVFYSYLENTTFLYPIKSNSRYEGEPISPRLYIQQEEIPIPEQWLHEIAINFYRYKNSGKPLLGEITTKILTYYLNNPQRSNKNLATLLKISVQKLYRYNGLIKKTAKATFGITFLDARNVANYWIEMGLGLSTSAYV